MTTANQPISLLFLNGDIADVFGELVESYGFKAELIKSELDLSENQKIITEPLYYRSLSDAHKENCLVIGNKQAEESVSCPFISQPLTPEKVERGLNEFLGRE